MATASSSPKASALSTGRALVLLQLTTRLLTFTLNQTLVRIAPPEVFGTAAIQFDLLCSTILFLSREGIRNALLRTRSSNTASEDQIRALSQVPLQLGVMVSALFTSIYLYTLPSSTARQPFFYASLAMYVISSGVELSIEPLYIRALRSDPPNMRVRVQAEGGMAIVKAIVTVICLLVSRNALIGFAIGQLCGSLWLAGRYSWEYGGLSLSFLKGPSAYHPPTLSLAAANIRQSFVKHVLTEADRFAVGYISPLGDQGGYAVAMNYGSLIARIIFQPIEETLLLHFTSSLSSPQTQNLLTYIIHISSHLLLLLPCFLPPLFTAIIPLLLPRRYLTDTTAPQTLETYLKFYLPLLSLNGLLESFHAASADSQQVAKQMRWMIAGSIHFVVTLWSLRTDMVKGVTTEEALIYASCASMGVRIVYAYRHAVGYFNRGDQFRVFTVRRIIPKAPVLAASVVSGIALRLLERAGRWETSWKGRAELLGTGGVLGLTTLLIIYRSERKDFIELRKALT